MKILLEHWQNWAASIARIEAEDFCRNVKLDIEQGIILKAKFEAAVLNGMEVAAEMAKMGHDLSAVKDAQTAFYRHCDTLGRNDSDAKPQHGCVLTETVQPEGRSSVHPPIPHLISGVLPEKERQTVADAAEALLGYLWDNIGPTADYPAPIKIDNKEDRNKLIALFYNLESALKWDSVLKQSES